MSRKQSDTRSVPNVSTQRQAPRVNRYTAQPGRTERFRMRNKILTDKTVSDGALRLFLFLDDEARGELRIAMTRPVIRRKTGVSLREIGNRFKELIGAGYLRSRRTLTGNVYEFVRAQAVRHDCTPRPGTSERDVPIEQIAQDPPTPLRGNEDKPAAASWDAPGIPASEAFPDDEPDEQPGPARNDNHCWFCGGLGVCGYGSNRSRCGVCRGTGQAKPVSGAGQSGNRDNSVLNPVDSLIGVSGKLGDGRLDTRSLGDDVEFLIDVVGSHRKRLGLANTLFDQPGVLRYGDVK